MAKRKPYEITEGYFAKALLTARNAVFGTSAKVKTHETLQRAERMLDDDAMIAAAELKRQLKQIKRKIK